MFKKNVAVPVAVLVLLILLVVAFLVRWAGDSITWQRNLAKNTISTMGGLAMEIPEGVDVLEYVRANGEDFRNSILFDSPEYVSLSYSNGFMAWCFFPETIRPGGCSPGGTSGSTEFCWLTSFLSGMATP